MYMFVPISRILSRLPEDDHLSCLIVANQIFAVQTILLWSTTLHPGKDFAVSLLSSNRIIPEGTLSLSALASLLAPLYLHTMGVTHYLAPTLDVGNVRTFLSEERSSDTNRLILYKNLTLSKGYARLLGVSA